MEETGKNYDMENSGQNNGSESNGQDAGQKTRVASRMPDRKYAYFRDDEILFLVKHTGTLISGEPLKEFQAVVNEELGYQAGFPEEPLEAISFPPLSDEEIEECKQLLLPDEVEKIRRGFSFVKYDLKPTENDPASLIAAAQGIHQRLIDRFNNRPIEGITLEGTTLNWLTSITSQAGGTGGPGGPPFPYYGNRKTAPYHLDIVDQLINANGGSIYGDGAGVDVVILDTAPCAQDLVAAYKEWPDHPLISTLLGPNGKLHLYPASYKQQQRMNCTSLNDHDYKMTDHGLFIAGIIHSIVPQAEIHLIEVLNQYGVGDFKSFVDGFGKVYSEKIYRPNRKLVFNCSWMFEFPLDDLHCHHLNQTGDPDAEFERRVRELTKNDQSLLFSLEDFFNRFYGLGRQVMAAAGNDGKERQQPVPARYPAALKRVTGIGAHGALQRGENGKFQSSSFSNIADTPERKGIVTFGGDVGEGKGVLGLYIGEFPGCCRNDSKWAWWAGTSFATPILTAAVASVLSRAGNNIRRTQDAIAKLYGVGAKIVLDGQADRQQDILPVTQS